MSGAYLSRGPKKLPKSTQKQTSHFADAVMNKSIIFLSDNLSDSTVVDGEDNSVLFQIRTPSGFKKSVTAITDKEGQVVGTYERK